MDKLLKDYTVIIELPVTWGDMDAFQHVNNTVYFRYFESARIRYFEEMDFNAYMKQTGIGPILASTQCRFKVPLSYPDTVSVGTRISKIESDRFWMDYVVVSHKLKRIAAEGDGIIVTYNYQTGQKTDIPDEIRSRLEKK